jgi:hypothetical protein
MLMPSGGAVLIPASAHRTPSSQFKEDGDPASFDTDGIEVEAKCGMNDVAFYKVEKTRGA